MNHTVTAIYDARNDTTGICVLRRSSNTANTHADQKFTGQFLESEGNLGLYHAQARLYDPEMPRFYGVDAMSSKYPGLSSYVYAANNPLSYIDPDGNDFFRHDETSAILWGNKTDETCEASDGSVCTNIGDTYQFVVDGR